MTSVREVHELPAAAGVSGIRGTRVRAAGAALMLGAVLAACGPGADDAAAGDSAPAAHTSAAAAAGATGTLALDGRSYTFRVVRCTPAGDEDGTVLYGRGSDAEGRTISVAVERIESAVMTDESVLVLFGDIRERDSWTADAHRLPDGRWFVDEAAVEPADGPLITIGADAVEVRARFHHERDDVAADGVLSAPCPVAAS